ncbi:autoinducer binding domain-containing protein [Zymobacter sp. IVIA_5232.4 C2]|uniref:autoinducer binding domain-containing protein n=1 Tax=Zymobacter sp. IVIA_5232.4 C2 TaxID=3394855 RepID=UPI0039C2E1C5
MNTNNWKIDLFTSLDSAHSFQSVMRAALNAIRPFGFDYCGWRTDLPLEGKIKHSGITALNAVEDEVYCTVVRGGYEKGPIPRHCAYSTTPISWQGTFEDDMFMQSPELMEAYYGLGHRGGWAITTIAPDGTRGMFYVESQHTLSQSDLYHAEQHMPWVSAAACMKINEIKEELPTTVTHKEKELLRVLSETNGSIKKTAEHTGWNINPLISNLKTIKKKLECRDLHSVITRATFLGLIS